MSYSRYPFKDIFEISYIHLGTFRREEDVGKISGVIWASCSSGTQQESGDH